MPVVVLPKRQKHHKEVKFIVDSCGKFEKLWQFSSFLVLRNLKVLEVCESDKIQISNIPKPTDRFAKENGCKIRILNPDKYK